MPCGSFLTEGFAGDTLKPWAKNWGPKLTATWVNWEKSPKDQSSLKKVAAWSASWLQLPEILWSRFTQPSENCELTNVYDFKPLNLEVSSYIAIHNKSCVLQTKTALRIRERWKAERFQLMWIGSLEKVWQQGRHFKWRANFLPTSHPSPKFSLQDKCC